MSEADPGALANDRCIRLEGSRTKAKAVSCLSIKQNFILRYITGKNRNPREDLVQRRIVELLPREDLEREVAAVGVRSDDANGREVDGGALGSGNQLREVCAGGLPKEHL